MKLPINLKEWICKYRSQLKPPVGNKVVYDDSDFIIMVVGGPNKRKDYHVDPNEEFFYQIEGDMTLKIFQNDKPENIIIKEGEIYLLPKLIPHSPQRYSDTVGLVIEYKRKKDELDMFQWYCEKCNQILNQLSVKLTDIEKQLPPLFDKFWNDQIARTCKHCNTYLDY